VSFTELPANAHHEMECFSPTTKRWPAGYHVRVTKMAGSPRRRPAVAVTPFLRKIPYFEKTTLEEADLLVSKISIQHSLHLSDRPLSRFRADP
jgi:hypothetical protein